MPISRIGTDGIDQTSSQQIGGISVGRGGGAVSTNTAVGASALAANTSGALSTAVGISSLAANTTGVRNSAIGGYSLTSNTSGGYNVAHGYEALAYNTTASYNTAVGYQAGYSNTTGTQNFFGGYQAGYGNTTGSGNTAIGYSAGGGLTTTDSNTAVGNNALTGSDSGGSGGNAAFGGDAMRFTTSGSNNTAIGRSALRSNTTAGGNTAVGYQAGYTNSTGTSNVYLGQQAGYNTTSTGNVFVGSGAGYYVTSGAKNTIIGRYDGNQGSLDIRTSSNNIVLSDGDGSVCGWWDNTQAFGLNRNSGGRYTVLNFYNAMAYKAQMYWDNLNNSLYVNGASGGVYLTNTGTSWTSNSDERLKENLTPIENGLSKVCSLRSVIGNFIADETKKPTPFLIAQDVQAVLPEAVTTSTLKDDETNTEYLGVAYTEVIPLLVAAIKELKAEFDAYKEAHP